MKTSIYCLFCLQLVSTNMLLGKIESCPICYEVRSGLMQVAIGTLYPMVLGPTAALMVKAMRKFTQTLS